MTRSDCCETRDNNDHIYVSDQHCGNLPNGVARNTWYTVTCGSGLWGTNVKIVQQNNSLINLMEIEVYGQTYTSLVLSIPSTGSYMNIDESQFVGHAPI